MPFEAPNAQSYSVFDCSTVYTYNQRTAPTLGYHGKQEIFSVPAEEDSINVRRFAKEISILL